MASTIKDESLLKQFSLIKNFEKTLKVGKKTKELYGIIKDEKRLQNL